MNKENKAKMEARQELVARENAIADATAQSLVSLREDFVKAQKSADRAILSAGQKGAWWLSCLMVRESFTIDEAFSQAKSELKREGIPISKLEVYRPLVPHAYSVRKGQATKGKFVANDDKMPKINWLTVQQYRDHLVVADMTAGEAVGRWQAVLDEVEEKAIEPFLIKLESKGFDAKKAKKEDKLDAVKTLANKLRKEKKSGKSGNSQTPEQIALSLVSKDETCLSFLNLCGNEILSRVLRVARQVLDARIDAAKRS